MTSVVPSPRSRKLDSVTTPKSLSRHDNRCGRTTSTYTACIVYVSPVVSLTIVVSKTPPGRKSTVMFSTGVRVPVGPPEVRQMFRLSHDRVPQGRAGDMGHFESG